MKPWRIVLDSVMLENMAALELARKVSWRPTRVASMLCTKLLFLVGDLELFFQADNLKCLNASFNSL